MVLRCPTACHIPIDRATEDASRFAAHSSLFRCISGQIAGVDAFDSADRGPAWCYLPCYLQREKDRRLRL